MKRFAVVLLLAAVATAEKSHDSEHYRLYTERPKPEADAMLAVLEAAWHEYGKHFQAFPKLEPGKRLVVRHFPTRRTWAAAIATPDAPEPAGGGLYYRSRREVYVYPQGTVYHSRSLLLHEAGHQFHFLARTRNEYPASWWYYEGVAEFLGGHYWDGKTLRLGVTPAVSLADYPAHALADVRAEGFDFAALVRGSAYTDNRPLAWALYSWLARGGENGEPQANFVAFRDDMDAGADPGPVFERCFGAPRDVFPSFRKWIEANQQPWEFVFQEWDGLGPGRLRGIHDTRVFPHTIARLKHAASRFEATLDVRTGQGGVVLDYEDDSNHTVAIVDASGSVLIEHFVDAKRNRRKRHSAPAATTYRIQLTRRDNEVFMNIGDVALGPWPRRGTHFGLAVRNSDLTFRDITWK